MSADLAELHHIADRRLRDATLVYTKGRRPEFDEDFWSTPGGVLCQANGACGNGVPLLQDGTVGSRHVGDEGSGAGCLLSRCTVVLPDRCRLLRRAAGLLCGLAGLL